MKISCQSCGAKYNIADEKVRGKIVKIACKKCGARIEIDGREAQEQAQDQDETRVFDQASAPAPGGPAGDSWTVSIDDNDQREVSTPQLIDLYRQGVVTADTFLWRDGMADWQAVRDVPELQAQLGSGAPAAYSAPPPAAPAYPSEPPTAIHPAAAAPSYNGGGYSAPQIETSNAARLGGSRRGGAVDLFAAQPAAAEEDDVATSAPPGGGLAGMAGPAAHGGAPIGARNENSVLFSLSALTASGPAQASSPMPADEEKSGLIDIQKLAAAAKPSNGGRDDRAKLDDIMNLGGGGAFGNALGAPILAPPPAAALSEVHGGSEEKKSNKGLIIGMAGVVALLLVVVIVLLMRKPDETAAKDKEKSGSVDTPKSDEKKDDKKVAAADTTAPAAPTDVAPDPAGGPIGKPGSKTTAGGTAPAKPGTTATGGATAAATETAKPSPASKCTTLDCAMGGAAAPPATTAKPAETAPAGGGEIDKNAAIAALKNVPYKDCGSGGAGKVTVTFGGNGSVQSAVVTAGEYDGGTKSCIQNRFKGAKVPAYGGAPKSFGWSVSL